MEVKDPLLGELGQTNAIDWKYISEGGQHAIFRYNPKEDASKLGGNYFYGKILRVDKDAFKAKETSKINQMYYDILQGLLNRSEQHLLYLDPPTFIKLPYSFLEGLRQQGINSSRIPSSRQLQWKNENIDPKNFELSTFVSSLLPNYRYAILPQGQCKTISVEIKPKAGYLATSPLVHPNHDIKYVTSRFQIFQELNYNGIISKGWNHGIGLKEKSNYDPLDFFSCKIDRVRRAVRALFECPQNNLKVYFRDNMIYGHEGGTGPGGSFGKYNDESANLHVLALEMVFGQRVLPKSQTGSTMLKNELVAVVSKILEQDPFLTILADLQSRYDELDVDGAILVYEKLVSLCNGSFREAEKLIDSNISALLIGEPDYDTDSRKNSDHFAELISFLANKDAPPNEDRVSLYSKGKELVNKLNLQDCADLLKRWLLSLTLCDVSFFVMIHNGSAAGKCDNRDKGWQNILTQHGQILQYQIKVIDYDQKPAKKLRNRAQAESKVALYSAGEMS